VSLLGAKGVGLDIGVEQVKVDFVWSPPWTPERLTPDGREQLQMMGYPV